MTLKTIPELIAEIRPNLRCISASEARSEIAENSGILIDVREAEEVLQHPVKGAINIPRGMIEMKASAMFPEADHPIYVHCATGARATLSGEQLCRLGYSKVTVITCDLESVTSSFA